MAQSPLRYSVDLAALHATCESNYARLMRLFPDYETANVREFQLSNGQRVRIEVVERCRYTTLMKVSQHVGQAVERLEGLDALDSWLMAPRFDVRAYHDARMLEVTAFQSRRQVRARYDYPNADMHAPDEKAQQNIFLAEWLSHCIEQGYSTLDVPSVVAGTADAS